MSANAEQVVIRRVPQRDERGHFISFAEGVDTTTRVERQYGSGRIPEEISTVGGLKQSAGKINPFERPRNSPGRQTRTES